MSGHYFSSRPLQLGTRRNLCCLHASSSGVCWGRFFKASNWSPCLHDVLLFLVCCFLREGSVSFIALDLRWQGHRASDTRGKKRCFLLPIMAWRQFFCDLFHLELTAGADMLFRCGSAYLCVYLWSHSHRDVVNDLWLSVTPSERPNESKISLSCRILSSQL